MEPLKRAAAAIVLQEALKDEGPQAVGDKLQELRQAIHSHISSLPARERPAARVRLNLLAEQIALEIVAGKILGGNIAESGGSGGDYMHDGPDDANDDAGGSAARDAERIERRKLAYEAAAAGSLSIIARVNALLTGATRRQCDVCTSDAVVCDSNTWCLKCPLCDKNAQLTYSLFPSISRYVMSPFDGLQVPKLLLPTEFVLNDGSSFINSMVLPEPIELAAPCDVCVERSKFSFSRWKAHLWEAKSSITVYTPGGTFSAARVTHVHCAEKNCTHSMPFPAAATPPTTINAPTLYVKLSLHASISTRLLNLYSEMNNSLKYGLPAEAVISHLAALGTSHTSIIPEERVRAALYATFVQDACIADLLHPTGILCLRCPTSSPRLPVKTTQAVTTEPPLNVSTVIVSSILECATTSNEVVSSVIPLGLDDGVELITLAMGAAQLSNLGTASIAQPLTKNSITELYEQRLVSFTLYSAPLRLYVDGILKLFVFGGSGGGDGINLGDKPINHPLSEVTCMIADWNSTLKKHPSSEGSATSCSGGNADFTASSEGEKSGSAASARKIQIYGSVLSACEHDAFYMCQGLPGGEQHVYHLNALLLVARSLGDVILISDISCQLMRTFARLAAEDPAFIYKFVEHLWPGKFSAATLTTAVGQDHAVFCTVVFTRIDEVIEEARVRVIIDALHCEGHLCSSLYGAPFKIGAGTGAPSIEALFSRLGPRGVNMRSMATSTEQTMLAATLLQFNATTALDAVRTSARRIIAVLDRLAEAVENFEIEMRTLDPLRPTDVELEIAAENNRVLAAAPNKPSGVAKAVHFLARATELVFSLRFCVATVAQGSTRSKNIDNVESKAIRDLFSTMTIPRNWPRPKYFTVSEAMGLLEAWDILTETARRKARPEIARANENADASIVRLVEALRGYYVEYKRLSSQISDGPGLKKAVTDRLQVQRSTVTKSIDRTLTALKTFSVNSKHRDLQIAVWPTPTKFCAAVNVAEVLPERFSLHIVGNGGPGIGRAVILKNRVARRTEDVTEARQNIARLPVNLDYAATALEHQARIAAALLRSPPSTEKELLTCIGVNYIFPSLNTTLDQPLATLPDSLLLRPHVLSPTGEAGLQLLISRNITAVARLRKDEASAKRLLAAVTLVPAGSIPSWDRRQVYATRYVSQLLEGTCTPEQFALHLTSFRGFPRGKAARRGVTLRSVDITGDDDDGEGVHEGAAGDDSNADDSDDDIIIVEDDDDDDDDDADEAAGRVEGSVEAGASVSATGGGDVEVGESAVD
jgi:hypothetical protein